MEVKQNFGLIILVAFVAMILAGDWRVTKIREHLGIKSPSQTFIEWIKSFPKWEDDNDGS